MVNNRQIYVTNYVLRIQQIDDVNCLFLSRERQLEMIMNRKALRWSVVMLIAACAVAGLASSSHGQSRDKPVRPAVGDKALDFELPTLDGERVRLSKLVADGPLVVLVLRGYPGYQCPLCNVQVGQFLGSAKKFEAAKARIVSIYPGPSESLQEHAEEFVRGKTLPGNFYLVLDHDYKFTNAYGLRWEARNETAYPATFVIDREQKIRFAKISNTHGDRASAQQTLDALPAK